MNIAKSSLVLGHIFKDNEGIYAYQYNIAITLLNTSTLVVLFKSVDLFYEKNMSDYWIKVNRKPTGFGGRLTVFGNNRNNTALIQTLKIFPRILYSINEKNTKNISENLIKFGHSNREILVFKVVITAEMHEGLL